LTLIKVRT